MVGRVEEIHALAFAIEGGDGANNQSYPDVIEALEGGEGPA